MKGLILLKDLIKNPTKAFDEISEHGENYLICSVLIVVLPKVIPMILYSDLSRFKDILKGIAEWLIVSVLLYIFGRALKGKVKFIGLLSAMGYAQFPTIFLPIVGYLILRSIPEDVIKIAQVGNNLTREQEMYSNYAHTDSNDCNFGFNCSSPNNLELRFERDSGEGIQQILNLESVLLRCCSSHS